MSNYYDRNRTFRKAGLIGSILAVTISIGIVGFMKQWDHSESLSSNIIGIWFGRFSHIRQVFDRPVQDQVDFLNKIRPVLDAPPPPKSFLRWLYGEDFANTVYHDSIHVVEFTVPYNSSNSSSGSSSSASAEEKEAEEVVVVEVPVACIFPLPSSSDNSNDTETVVRLPLILFFHGGGLILGSEKMDWVFVKYIAKKVNAIVCSVGYRLAPEHPFPAGVEDSLAAALALMGVTDKGDVVDDDSSIVNKELGGSVQVDRTKVATYGMSAGGYMAGHTTRLLAYHGISIQMQVSIIPMVQPFSGTNSLMRYFHSALVWDGEWNTYAWSAYLKGYYTNQIYTNDSFLSDWKLSLLVDPPNHESPDFVKNLPPTYIQISTKDILRDEGEMYAMKLKSQGKLIDFDEYNVCHIGPLPPHPGFEKSIQLMIKYLNEK